MSVERRVRSRAFVAGYRTAKTQMQGDFERLREQIARDVENLQAEMLRLATDLAAARAEVEQLQGLVNAAPPTERLH
jgi:hypothetical protein